MRTSKMILPRYAEGFRCIGPACEDSCCVGWNVGIDQASYLKYQELPESPLRTLLQQSIRPCQPGDAAASQGHFAVIEMNERHSCPMHNAAGLCEIQAQMGESYLSQTCSSFPRLSFKAGAHTVDTLSLSCPEAARIVLGSAELTNAGQPDAPRESWEDDPRKARSLAAYFWPVREFTVELLRNRKFELWQRLFLLGTYCRRLEAVAAGQVQGGFAAMQDGFAAALTQDDLKAQMETLQAHPTHQLDMVLHLLQAPQFQVKISARYEETVTAFLQGIGGAGKSIEEQSLAYAEAHERFYKPFFAAHPQVLENLLVNMVFRGTFPFGQQMFTPGAALQPAQEYARLVTEFALIKGMLIGVAGCQRDGFALPHVEQTVQVLAKYFEHNELFLRHAVELLTAKGLNTAPGLTMLVRN